MPAVSDRTDTIVALLDYRSGRRALRRARRPHPGGARARRRRARRDGALGRAVSRSCGGAARRAFAVAAGSRLFILARRLRHGGGDRARRPALDADLPPPRRPLRRRPRLALRPVGALGRRLAHQDRRRRVRRERRQHGLLPALPAAAALRRRALRRQPAADRDGHLGGLLRRRDGAALPAGARAVRRADRRAHRRADLAGADLALLPGRVHRVALPAPLPGLLHLGAQGQLEARRPGRPCSPPSPAARASSSIVPDGGLLLRAARLELATHRPARREPPARAGRAC